MKSPFLSLFVYKVLKGHIRPFALKAVVQMDEGKTFSTLSTNTPIGAFSIGKWHAYWGET